MGLLKVDGKSCKISIGSLAGAFLTAELTDLTLT